MTQLTSRVVKDGAGLPTTICKFVSFLLEQLSKEAREAVKELALDEANKRDQLLAGALNPTGPGGGHLGDVPDPSKKLSLDAIVARRVR